MNLPSSIDLLIAGHVSSIHRRHRHRCGRHLAFAYLFDLQQLWFNAAAKPVTKWFFRFAAGLSLLELRQRILARLMDTTLPALSELR